ncbi:IS605 OrfB family transposase [Streptomyces sp. V4I23]|nr:IS605 OrfB family transposase [Streptomyces sp. V4I23]
MIVKLVVQVRLLELTGIRERVRLRKPQRAALHSWAFAQLGEFIAYKARRAGVPVVYVDPAYTSRTCAECGCIDKANRASPARFACRSCGFVDHADRNGSRNLRAERGSCGDAGPCRRPLLHPSGPEVELDADAASRPVMPVVQALSPKRQLT